MKLRTLIIDDEPIALEKLRNYVNKTPFLELIGECHNGFDAIDLLARTEADLIVTDINMPDLNGLEFVRALQSPPAVIFTTAHSHYAVDSYRVSALDYLLKPYDYADFYRAVTKALDRSKSAAVQSPQNQSIFIKVDYRYVRVELADIQYIKGYGEYLQIYVRDSETPLVTLSSFAAIKERLTPDFLQVHRSYIANMNHVSQIERNRLVIAPEIYIPVSDSYKPAILAKIGGPQP